MLHIAFLRFSALKMILVTEKMKTIEKIKIIKQFLLKHFFPFYKITIRACNLMRATFVEMKKITTYFF